MSVQQHVFKLGDSVQFRSGGTAMTIVGVTEGLAECVWMDRAGKDRSRTVPVEALMHDTLGATGDLMFVGYDAFLEGKGNA